MFHGDKVLLNEGDLTPEVAIARAREEAGYDDFGDDTLLESLDVFLRCVQSDLEFTEMGRLNLEGIVHRFLVNRLRLNRDISQHPEILEEDVSDPIMILGMPRTGTTKLQRLVSSDPNMQELLLWRLLNPAPFDEERDGGEPEGRLAFAKIVEEATRANTTFTASHETAAMEPDEDSFLLLFTFKYSLLYTLFPSPSYLEWIRSQPRQHTHDIERQLLQYLQWQNGGKNGKRWILKNPGAVGCVKEVKQAFPNVTFVHLHRDLVEVMPSYCRLMEGVLEPLLKNLDLHEHGQNCLDFWAYEMHRYHDARRELGNSIEVLDLPYLNVVKDPMPAVESIYERAGIELSEEGRNAMQAWQADNQQHKHGKAVYSLERYGLTAGGIAAAIPKV